MREILFRGQTRRKGEKVYINGEPVASNWVCGGILPNNAGGVFSVIYQYEPDVKKFAVYTDTVGQFTGLTDKNGTKIFEGDILQYNTLEDFDCQSVVKFGEWERIDSEGFSSRQMGFYVEVNNFTAPDWFDNAINDFPDYKSKQSVLELENCCEVIGNIHDNPELLEGEQE